MRSSGVLVLGVALHPVYGTETLCWCEQGGAWIGNVHRYDGRWVASVPGEPWNVEIGAAETRPGAVRLLLARAREEGR